MTCAIVVVHVLSDIFIERKENGYPIIFSDWPHILDLWLVTLPPMFDILGQFVINYCNSKSALTVGIWSGREL